MFTQCPELQSCGALYPVWLNGLKMLRIIDLKIPYTAYVYQFINLKLKLQFQTYMCTNNAQYLAMHKSTSFFLPMTTRHITQY